MVAEVEKQMHPNIVNSCSRTGTLRNSKLTYKTVALCSF